jgi:hypothetical protein
VPGLRRADERRPALRRVCVVTRPRKVALTDHEIQMLEIAAREWLQRHRTDLWSDKEIAAAESGHATLRRFVEARNKRPCDRCDAKAGRPCVEGCSNESGRAS